MSLRVKKRTILTSISILSILAFSGCNSGKKSEEATSEKPVEVPALPPNIILFIGDGTGLSQLSTLWYSEGHPEKPNYEKFEVVGLSKTNSSSHKITDSAAGATAFSTGEKTYNGAIGVDKDSADLELITNVLSAKGYAIGLIATSSITHATPASFYAHAKSRRLEEEIAAQMHTSKVDFFAGGGLQFFGKRKDGNNYLDSLQKVGFDIDTQSIDHDLKSKRQAYLLADNAMKSMIAGRGDFLPKATKKAMKVLSNKQKPFFLMVEGSMIDWGGHANDADSIITELRDLDKAIGEAFAFAQENPNTLIVALADHETGGFSIPGTVVQSFGKRTVDDYNKPVYKFTTGGHTCVHIPVFASGPGAGAFSGIYENNTVFNKLLSVTAL